MRFEILEKALKEKNMVTVAQIAPAVRVGIGELFGFEAGVNLDKKLVGALRKIGFDYVFDTSFGADVAVMEECSEFEEKLNSGGPFPMINSCCPGTVSFLEHSYPELVANMATVKSPMEVTGVLIKYIFAKEKKINPDKICSVAIMPCVIKKAEALRPELRMDGKLIIDGVLTTRELAELLKEKGVDLKNCKESDFDMMFGVSSGGGILFGSTGGVSEASIRKYAQLHGVPLEKIDNKILRGMEGVREVTYKLDGREIKIAVINSLRNASPLLNDKIRREKYNFIEIMACLGGCVGGAGQPTSTIEILQKRREGLFSIDSKSTIKNSAQNPQIKELYSKYLEHPRSEIALKLLHTRFEKICTNCF